MTLTKIRPFTLNDAQDVVDLFNAHSQFLYGADDTDFDEMMIDWTRPGVNLDDLARVVENQQGEIIGYIEVWDISKPHVTKYAWGCLHPDAWDEDVFRAMMSWAEKRGRERIDLAPEGTRVILSQGMSNLDINKKRALEAYGYENVRNFFRMVIELDQTPPQPQIPEGLTIVPIDLDNELRQAVEALEEGFSDHWGHVPRSIDEQMEQWQHHIEQSKDFDPSVWFLVKDGDEIAGVCRCSNKTTEDPDMAWVNQLCVLRSWRRRGLGMAMLQHAFGEFYRRGKQRVGLAVDATSLTNATRLYEKAGMHVNRQFDTYTFELRPGKDITTS
ncbi:GNAT family N-acetyltransferase [Chloroflexota bacterium]|nr:GNAT family N-acetyltransferase [Chloroflexota bacterium]